MYKWERTNRMIDSPVGTKVALTHQRTVLPQYSKSTYMQGVNQVSQFKEEVEMFEQLVETTTVPVSKAHYRKERSGDGAVYTFLKRSTDIVVTSAALLLLLPLMLFIAVLVKLDSPGSAFFIQKRVGSKRKVENGEIKWEVTTFPMFKFRSMKQNADQSLHQAHIKAYAEGQLKGDKADSAQFKLKEDPRITRLGKFLRKTSLDELPQLLNILRGEMSLVGPRPVPEYEVAYYEPAHFERLEALPGMTGLWQVYGRGRVTFDEMMEMDIEYVRTRNLWLDIKLLLATVPAAVRGEGAK